MMETLLPCGFDESMAPRYVAGRLSEEEADAFEAHYFACEGCWRAVRAAQELRVALEATQGTRGRRRAWLPLAAAAALFCALGAWMLARQPGRAFRAGTGPGLAVSVSGEPAAVAVSWTRVPGARSYRARVVTAEGGLVTERELGGPPLLLEKRTLPDATLYVDVQALGPDRQVLASSEPLRFAR